MGEGDMTIKEMNSCVIYFSHRKVEEIVATITPYLKSFFIEQNVLDFKECLGPFLKLNYKSDKTIDDFSEDELFIINSTMVYILFDRIEEDKILFSIIKKIKKKSSKPVKLKDILDLLIFDIKKYPNYSETIKFVEKRELTEKEKEFKRKIENDFELNIF